MRSFLLAAVLTLCAATVATAHVERASYWPDPAVDNSVPGGTGGKVPKARSLASAVAKGQAGTTRVVCKANSLKLLGVSIATARKSGYDIRPSDHRSFSAKEAKRLKAVNRKLFKRCSFKEIQPAVNASGNNDRVVVMPGLYTEPTARKAPTNDPKCADLKILNDRGEPTALSYAYQMKCPNDQNLIAVMGRAVGPGKDPAQPRPDRHGIPNLGKCIRCNFQIEGSGVSADDVVVDGGRVASGNGGPVDAKKDVGIRADRADGFVLRNMTIRHVREHDIYILESDGYLLDRFKTYWAGEYGVLTFVEDHGVMRNCDAAGFGDSGLYPGAGAETGTQAVKEGTEKKRRYNQRITHCDSHHSTLGYSGTDGNAIHVDHNNFYDNAMGFSTDVFTASGHPGYPQDSDLVEFNNFYSNNFNPYEHPDIIKPSVPVPVGTGMWIAGGNDNIIRNNRFYDNWRRATMLYAVPDTFVCPQADDNNLHGCDPSKIQTSMDNRYYGNTLGVAPDGTVMPNGQDFWWDNWTGNTGNCWYKNTAAPGASLHNAPASLPDCVGGTAPASSVGTGDAGNESELLGCLSAVEQDQDSPGTTGCSWFDTPPKPGS
ncbi:MAG: hypothetical protein JWM73_236 [Solirubrobacterales bacterium]|nr:hypothetical protein [Solirubrobacterales bacterium]